VPDSRLIVFELDTPSTCANVAYMNADGSHMVVLPLANGDICEAMPSFSPDGQRIFYEAFNGHRDAIWSMTLAGADRALGHLLPGISRTIRRASPPRGQGLGGRSPLVGSRNSVTVGA
jgi:Tol biopolymer transport system component